MAPENHFPAGTISYGFTGITTFMRSPYMSLEEMEVRKPSIIVMGVPFDEGAPFMPGSRFGPRTVREHSLRFSKEGIYDHQSDKVLLKEEMDKDRMIDIGDIDVIPTDVGGTFRKISDTVQKVMEREALLISIGGDHSITYPIVRAIKRPIHVIHFDAHADFLPVYPGYEHTNSHAFTHISRMNHVKSLTQIGYRSIRELSGIDSRAAGNRVIGMAEFRQLGPEGIAKVIPEGEECYVTIDIDALDSSLVPGCVSAEPDGLLYHELRDSLKEIALHNKIIGFEIVEVTPSLDVGTGITSYIAAQTLIEFLGQICDQPWWQEKNLD